MHFSLLIWCFSQSATKNIVITLKFCCPVCSIFLDTMWDPIHNYNVQDNYTTFPLVKLPLWISYGIIEKVVVIFAKHHYFELLNIKKTICQSQSVTTSSFVKSHSSTSSIKSNNVLSSSDNTFVSHQGFPQNVRRYVSEFYIEWWSQIA